MEQDKLLKVDNTIEKLCNFLQKETERVASIYESQELAEMTKALAELMSARAKFNQFSFSLRATNLLQISCMNSATRSPPSLFAEALEFESLATVISTVLLIKS